MVSYRFVLVYVRDFYGSSYPAEFIINTLASFTLRASIWTYRYNAIQKMRYGTVARKLVSIHPGFPYTTVYGMNELTGLILILI